MVHDNLKICHSTMFTLEYVMLCYVMSGRVALHCIALYCIVWHRMALYCIVLYCITLRCIVLRCIVLHCIVLRLLYCVVLDCVVLHTAQSTATGCLIWSRGASRTDSPSSSCPTPMEHAMRLTSLQRRSTSDGASCGTWPLLLAEQPPPPRWRRHSTCTCIGS
jgi:hypothetical protein